MLRSDKIYKCDLNVQFGVCFGIFMVMLLYRGDGDR